MLIRTARLRQQVYVKWMVLSYHRPKGNDLHTGRPRPRNGLCNVTQTHPGSRRVSDKISTDGQVGPLAWGRVPIAIAIAIPRSQELPAAIARNPRRQCRAHAEFIKTRCSIFPPSPLPMSHPPKTDGAQVNQERQTW